MLCIAATIRYIHIFIIYNIDCDAARATTALSQLHAFSIANMYSMYSTYCTVQYVLFRILHVRLCCTTVRRHTYISSH